MCDCISTVNNLLREQNTCLVTTMFSIPEVVAVGTEKVNSKSKRGPAKMVANYCPFCGEKYPRGESTLKMPEAA